MVILRALGLGDLLAAVPPLRALRTSHAGHERVLAAPRAFVPLLPLLDGAVDRIVDVDFRDRVGHLPDRLAGPDLAVNLHGRGPQSHAALAALGPRDLISFADPRHAPGGPPWPGEAHERVRWCQLLWHHGVAADPDDLAITRPAAASGHRWTTATVLHPGASAPARRWPVARWAAVARHEHDRGHRVVVTGGPAEVELATSVARAAGLDADAVLAGRTDVGDLAALIAAAGRVVCGDTGVAHLATALHTPSVVLFGPTTPRRWGPPAVARHRALWAGETGDPHAARPHHGLLAIGVDDVTAALDALPDRAPAPGVSG